MLPMHVCGKQVADPLIASIFAHIRHALTDDTFDRMKIKSGVKKSREKFYSVGSSIRDDQQFSLSCIIEMWLGI